MVVVAFGVYVLLSSQKSMQVATLPPTTTVPEGGNTPTSTTSPATATGTSTSTPAPAVAAGQYKDGTYKGSVADAFYGNLQVQAVISGGELVDCVPLQYPNESGHTLEVSQTDLPILKQELSHPRERRREYCFRERRRQAKHSSSRSERRLRWQNKSVIPALSPAQAPTGIQD